MSLSKKLLAVIYSLLLLLASVAIVVEGLATLQLLSRLNHIDAYPGLYISIMPFGIPSLFIAPVFLLLSYLLLGRVWPALPVVSQKKLLQIALPAVILLVLSRIALAVFLPGYLAAAGFTYCDELTDSSAFSADVWVKHEAYCHPRAHLVKRDMLNWLDEQQAAQRSPTADDVNTQIDLFLAQ